MIKCDEFLMNILSDCMNFMSYMHHIEIYLNNGQISTKNQNSHGIRHKKFGISTENGRRRITK